MDDLVTWLRAQLDGDEREIGKHPDGAYEYDIEATEESNYPSLPILVIGKKRALAEVEAKRRLLDYLVDLEDKALDGNWWNIDTYEPIQLLALPYADRPGYREEWRP